MENNKIFIIKNNDLISNIENNELYKYDISGDGYASYLLFKKNDDKIISCNANLVENDTLQLSTLDDDNIQYSVIDYNIVKDCTIQQFYQTVLEQYEKTMDLRNSDKTNLFVFESKIPIDLISNKDIVIGETKEKINEFINDNEEHQNKHIDCILINLDTKETITFASDGLEEMIMFAPYTKDNETGYLDIPEWDFNFDGYIFDELEKGYQVGFMSEETHYGIWNSLKELYPEDIEHKNGVQNYLQFCADNGITKEYLDRKTNLDTPNIMNLFEGLALHETRCNDNLTILAEGFRNDQSVALVEKNIPSMNIKEYIVAFNPVIDENNNLSWGYGRYYYDEKSGKEAYKTVINGGNLSFHNPDERKSHEQDR